MSLRFALEGLPPAMRAQAEAKLRGTGAVRDVLLLADPKPPQKPATASQPPRKRPCKPKGSVDLKPRRRLGRKALATPTGRLLWQIHCAGVDEPVREHRFHPTRKWRFDLAWTARKLALEIEGITHTGGRHQRPAGFINDCRKYNSAALMGWTVLRVTPDMIRRAEAIKLLEEWFKGRSECPASPHP